jgi:hypothetical protein
MHPNELVHNRLMRALWMAEESLRDGTEFAAA